MEESLSAELAALALYLRTVLATISGPSPSTASRMRALPA
jgi:hypothetical protein